MLAKKILFSPFVDQEVWTNLYKCKFTWQYLPNAHDESLCVRVSGERLAHYFLVTAQFKPNK